MFVAVTVGERWSNPVAQGPETLKDSFKVTKEVIAELGPRALQDDVQGKSPNGLPGPQSGVL